MTIQEAGVPITGVSVPEPGNAASVTVTPPALQAQAQPAIDAFDWSPAAEDAWMLRQLRQRAAGSVATLDDELRLLLRAMLRVLVGELNTLRALHGLPPLTAAAIRQAMQDALTSGQGDI